MSSTFTCTHTFSAPLARVWALWTEEAQIAAATAPPGGSFTSPVFELRVGGLHHYCSRTAEGVETWGLRRYTAITPGVRLAWEQSFSDASGAVTRPPMAPAFPARIQSTLDLEDAGEGRTRVTLRWESLDATPDEESFFASIHEGMRGGWAHTFAGLDAYLARVG